MQVAGTFNLATVLARSLRAGAAPALRTADSSGADGYRETGDPSASGAVAGRSDGSPESRAPDSQQADGYRQSMAVGPAQTEPWQAVAGAALGGVSLAAPGAVLGYRLGERYGMRVVQACVPHALDLMAKGWLSPQTAIRLARYALNPVFQAQAGAMALGSVGLIVGTLAGAALIESASR